MRILNRVRHSLVVARFEPGKPAEARFVGYAVHLVDTDEFLAQLEITPEATRRVWARRPDDALVFLTCPISRTTNQDFHARILHHGIIRFCKITNMQCSGREIDEEHRVD